MSSTGIHLSSASNESSSGSTSPMGTGAESQLLSTRSISARASARRASCQNPRETHTIANTTVSAR